jgi:hypothetical protein
LRSVDLIDHDDVDLAAADILQELLQGGAVEGGAGQASIVIAGPDQSPPLVGLTLDIGLAGLALGVERIELEIEIMFGGFTGVDRAAESLPRRVWSHRPASVRPRRPKKRYPFQGVPVMARATAERLE